MQPLQNPPLSDMTDQTSEWMQDQHTATAFFHILYHLCGNQPAVTGIAALRQNPLHFLLQFWERQIRLEPVCLPDHRKQMFLCLTQPVEHKGTGFRHDGIVLVLFCLIPLCIHQIQTVVDETTTVRLHSLPEQKTFDIIISQFRIFHIDLTGDANSLFLPGFHRYLRKYFAGIPVIFLSGVPSVPVSPNALAQFLFHLTADAVRLSRILFVGLHLLVQAHDQIAIASGSNPTGQQ